MRVFWLRVYEWLSQIRLRRSLLSGGCVTNLVTHRAGLGRVWSLTCSSQCSTRRQTHKPIEEPKCLFAFRHSLFIPKDDCRFLVEGWKQNIIWEAQVGIFVEQCKWGNFNIVKKVQNNFLDSRRYQDGLSEIVMVLFPLHFQASSAWWEKPRS